MNKNALRQKYKLCRKELPQKRRDEAKKNLLEEFYPHLKSFQRILSFASLHEEIDLWPLNALLVKEARLYLPKLEKELIIPYHVTDLNSQLEKSPLQVLEPNPDLCQKIEKQNLDCILVPGLCFDEKNYRLGYGIGHFDRFLKDILAIPTLGLGFKEQFISRLPVEAHDIALTKIYLF